MSKVAIFCGLFLAIVSTVVACNSKKVELDQYVVISVYETQGFITDRDKTKLVLEHRRDRVFFDGLWSFEDNKRFSVEILSDALEEVKPGDVLTSAQLDELKGRSILGRAWDFLKKPR